MGDPCAHPGKCLIVFVLFLFLKKREIFSTLTWQAGDTLQGLLTITRVPPLQAGPAVGEVGEGRLSPQDPLLTVLARKGPGDPEGLRGVGQLEGLSNSMWLSKTRPPQTQSRAGCTGASSKYSQVRTQTWAVAPPHALVPGHSHCTLPGAS